MLKNTSYDITFVVLHSFYVVEPKNFPLLKWQYRAGAGAGAGAGAEIMDKGGAKKEPEPKINNFGSATLLKIVQIDLKWVICTLNFF